MNLQNPLPENLTRKEIEAEQLNKLRSLLSAVGSSNSFWCERFSRANIDVSSIHALDDVRELPFTAKTDLVNDHQSHRPYGSNLTYELPRYSRMHQTSGTKGTPIRWLDTPASWNWFMQCWAQIYRIVGLREDDRLAFPFSFGPFIGFWAAFEGAARLGNLCLAGGGMSSQARLAMIADNRATVVCCTPTYALRLAEVAEEQGIDLRSGSVRALIVAGEPGGGIPATRRRIEEAWGARLFDHWGMTEIGSLAVECVENPEGLHLLETECIAEIIDPQTGEPVAAGTEGELVLTNLGRVGSPLIRYRTGDLVRADVKPCPCGRELLRLEGGVLGRTDDMVTIRGNNVFPTSLEAILREFEEIAEYRIEVRTARSMLEMQIDIEPTEQGMQSGHVESLVQSVERNIKDRLNFHADVHLVPCGSLPRFELKGRRFFIRSESSE
ncbi:MAG: phenylacetate--CoA ligase [Planctomycetaceae bacterium]